MKATVITNEEIDKLKVSSLPTRPTAPAAFGGRGYTAKEMKEAFDRLPLLIIERLNALINSISQVGADCLASMIPTGIIEHHTLQDLFSDILEGNILSYMYLGDVPFINHITALRADVDKLLANAGIPPTEV